MTLGGASATLAESEVVSVSATLVAVAFDADVIIGKLVQALGVMLESCLLVCLDPGFVEIEQDDLELTVAARRADDACEVVAALARATVAVERALTVIDATSVVTTVTVGAAPSGVQIAAGSAAIVLADLSVEAVAVSLTEVRDCGAAIVAALLSSLAIAVCHAIAAHAVNTKVRTSIVADAVVVVVAIRPARPTRGQRYGNCG